MIAYENYKHCFILQQVRHCGCAGWHLKASKDLTGLGDVLVLEAHQHVGGRAAPIQHGPFEGFQQGRADQKLKNLSGDVLLDLELRGAQWIHGGVPCPKRLDPDVLCVVLLESQSLENPIYILKG